MSTAQSPHNFLERPYPYVCPRPASELGRARVSLVVLGLWSH